DQAGKQQVFSADSVAEKASVVQIGQFQVRFAAAAVRFIGRRKGPRGHARRDRQQNQREPAEAGSREGGCKALHCSARHRRTFWPELRSQPHIDIRLFDCKE
ncbi:MAG TPA: hypothetical protein VFX03_02810, partial [Thermomicrobiales bacterium]|nr:hypothetical protein [Thermomicrobiales bacterium]